MRCKSCNANCDLDDRFCYNCGSYLKDKIVFIDEKDHQKPLKFIGVTFSFLSLFILLLALFMHFVSEKTGKIYLNNDLYFIENNKQIDSLYGYYKTSIEYNTTYEKEKVFNLNDGKNLIINHSDEQKNKCQSIKIKDIENRISQNFQITSVNLCEMDYQLALELEKIFQQIFDKFPMTKGYMTNLTLMNPKANDNFIAAYIPIFQFANTNSNINDYPLITKSMLILNSNYFLNYEFLNNTIIQGAQRGYFPKNAYGLSSVAHELGHYISYVALLKNYNIDSLVFVNNEQLTTALKVSEDINNGIFSKQIISKAYQNFLTDYPNSDMSETDFCASISDYAVSTIYDETIAEAVHDYFLNDTNASIASLEIINVLNDILNGGKI